MEFVCEDPESVSMQLPINELFTNWNKLISAFRTGGQESAPDSDLNSGSATEEGQASVVEA